jgi:hypothetical protein
MGIFSRNISQMNVHVSTASIVYPVQGRHNLVAARGDWLGPEGARRGAQEREEGKEGRGGRERKGGRLPFRKWVCHSIYSVDTIATAA